ncbi:ABC transporter substrate-binding protein [Clostridia bacterium]|nr:ABC transporter substrate-binding protein [Clostridia bacterium]
MKTKMKRFAAITATLLLLCGLLAACGGGSGSGGGGGKSESGQVYFQNFKPEQDEAYQAIAAEYTKETGVPVKVITAASGTYEQSLRSEIAKKDAPTIFQINGPVGYASWKDYTADLSASEVYTHLTDKSLAITGEDGGVYGIPLTIEGYGIIVNNKIAAQYFALPGAQATSLDEITTFAKLKAVVEDMQSKASDLRIDGVFASTSLKPGEDWRWQTHLMNVPIYYEWSGEDADLSDPAATAEIKFQYSDNFKDIFDLYLNNSTIKPTVAGSKTVDDSMAEFALGKAVMVQNGNWAYGQISGVDGNTVAAEDVTFLPIYIGAPGEETQGLCIGTENFFCINKNASEADQKASLDFMNWLYTSDAGKAHVTNDLGFIAPFDTFTDADKPADPLGQQVMDWSAKSGIQNVPWNFTVFPSQQFKDNFGGYLLLYAQDQMGWSDVTSKVIADWAAEKAAAA